MTKLKEKEAQQGLANASFHKPGISSAGAGKILADPFLYCEYDVLTKRKMRFGRGIQAQSCIDIPQRPHRSIHAKKTG